MAGGHSSSSTSTATPSTVTHAGAALATNAVDGGTESVPPPPRSEDAGGTTESTGMQFTASQSQLMLNLLRSHIPALHHMPPNDLQFIVPCAGMQLKLPDGRQPFSAHYPFMLHGGDRRQHRKPLWSMPNEDGVVFARTCAQFVMSMQSCDSTAPITPVSCESCLLLNTEGDVRSLSAEAKLLRIVLHNSCDDSYLYKTWTRVQG